MPTISPRWFLVLPLVLGLFALGCTGPSDEKGVVWKVGTFAQTGQARNRVESRLYSETGKWHSPLIGGRVALDLQTPVGFEASAEASGLWTDNDRETWTYEGYTVGQNDLTATSREARLLAGFGGDVEEVGHFSVLGGMTYRKLQLRRKFSDGTTTEWNSGLPFATVEGRALLPVPLPDDDDENRLSFDTRLSFGWLLDPKADVEGAGTIEGQQGWLLRWRAGFDYQLTPVTSLYLGGFVESMDLNGGTKGTTAEWPDSVTNDGGFELGLQFKF